MHIALPLKYRPRTLGEIRGQEYVQKTISNAILSGKIAPAYLFAGSHGTGKTSCARILAKSLNCSSSDGPTISPCGLCQSCRSIEKGTNLDVAEIDAASHNGVDDARKLIERSNFAPAMGRYRIFILDECHQLTQQAFNALLKCLEEPPARVVFILCTTESNKVLATITSRCQVFSFRALAVSAIVEQLTHIAKQEAIEIADEAKYAIARVAEGGLRDALQILEQLSLLGEKITVNHVLEMSGSIGSSDLVNILRAVQASDTLSLLKLSRLLVDSGIAPKAILLSLLACYRDLLVVMAVPNSQQLTTSAISFSKLQAISKTWDLRSVEDGFEQLRTSQYQLKSSVNASLWLEVCLLGLANAHQSQGNGADSGKPAFNTSTTSTGHEELWEKVVSSTGENNRKLLSKAQLIRLEDKRAVLAVPAKYLSRFNNNIDKVQKMLTLAAGTELVVSIEESR